MTECNGCGRCCEVVPLGYSQIDASLLLLAGSIDESEARWVINDLVPMTRREVKRLQPHLLAHNIIPLPDAVLRNEIGVMPEFYSCRKWDPDTRRCTDYDNRPSPCRHYPWYGSPPDPMKALHEECAFRADVGQPVKLMPTRGSS